MPLADNCIVVGLTGAFGSGCTTAARFLRDELGFTAVKMSDMIRRHLGNPDASRKELQRAGDELRDEHGPDYLIKLVMESVGDGDPVRFLAIDGIRNLGEVRALRSSFGERFSLVAILASTEMRWLRISEDYRDHGLDLPQFLEDDQRDQNEEIPEGQQVQLCVDAADVIIDNTSAVTLHEYHEKVLAYAGLISGTTTRRASPDEIVMHIAYSVAHGSKCLKRHVGAVLVDGQGQLISSGYNENPMNTAPCVEEDEYGGRCYRDLIRNDHFSQLAAQGARCPVCGEPLPPITGPPWRCPSCFDKGRKTNLEQYYFPDRAMTWCTAVHAEQAALLAAGRRARDAVLYTTTFPCFPCAEQLSQAGVKEVVYTEAYPDVKSAHRLRLARIPYRQFEGVKSSAFERFFSTTRPT